MAEQTLEEIELTIKWHMVPDDDNLIKFEGREDPYEMTDAVKEFIKSKNISQTAKVKVAINPKGGENEKGIVERIEVIEDNTKTEEVPKEETTDVPAQTKGNVKELTVGGVGLEKKNIIFKEEDDVWYQLDDNIDAQVVKDTMTHQTVIVSIIKVDGDKDIVDSIKLSGNPTSTESDKSETRAGNGSIQASIESQVAVEHACLIVSKTIDKDTDPETIKTRIKSIAEHNYQTIQDLKKK